MLRRRSPLHPMVCRLTTLLLGAALALPAAAAPVIAPVPPQGPAKVRFAPDFPALHDATYGFRIGGFGGVQAGLPRRHVPVIFVHGNTVDHADWYPVRDAFKAAGWSDQELWALSYNGLGGNGAMLTVSNPERDAEHTEMGYDGATHQTDNDSNVADLYAFIQAVRQYTGSSKFTLVTHSLGVTLARKTLKVHPELRPHLLAFVGIAGANHGTSLCPPGSETLIVSCNEIALGTQWLKDLNGSSGQDETYGPARWMTVYDNTGLGDPSYLTALYADSPALKGATNRRFPLTYHNDLRLQPRIITLYRQFIEAAETGAPNPPYQGGLLGGPLPELPPLPAAPALPALR